MIISLRYRTSDMFYFCISKSVSEKFNSFQKKNFESIFKTKNIQGDPKKSLWCDLEGSVWQILKCFLMESFSLYIHIFSRS